MNWRVGNGKVPGTFTSPTRETELAEEYLLQVVTAWIGNSELVASKHYLQVTDEHFKRAAEVQSNKAMQKAVQQLHESLGNDSKLKNAESGELLASGAVSGTCGNLPESSKCLQNKGMPTGGLEQSEKQSEKTVFSKARGAESGAQHATSRQLKPVADSRSTKKALGYTLSHAPCMDPQLQQITDAWPTLPKAIRLGVLALIQAAKE